MRPTLVAIPAPIGSQPAASLPAPALEIVRGLRDFVAENPRTARRLLAAIGMPCPIAELDVREFSEHSSEREIPALLAPLRAGRALGLLSEAGCPAIADPGAALVEAAHAAGYAVQPLVGPSAIVLALMASGLEGQRFAFSGYLPREASERERRIVALEQRSRRERATEIFIETPYRNEALAAALLKCCADGTRICFASGLTCDDESVRTASAAAWRRAPPQLGRRPTVFLLQAI
jgi:16S rRNA (cytidine1402-2'-O)-methyltransferase